jgi:hypothetical protein
MDRVVSIVGVVVELNGFDVIVESVELVVGEGVGVGE